LYDDVVGSDSVNATRPASAPGVLRTFRSAYHGDYPERYREPMDSTFWSILGSELKPDLEILDVGSGRRPTVAPEIRPDGCTYVGLDISRTELEAAAPGSYDEIVVSDAAVPRPELASRFDLAVSFQVFEHLSSVAAAFEALRSYLRPGGVLVTQFSGRYSVFAVANRLLPHELSKQVLTRLLNRDPATIFPAPYDHCTHKALRQMLASWSASEIVPLYIAGQYFDFSRLAKAAYIGLEQPIYERDIRSLATYYIVRAVR
jgi:SAM-dependent methyltransferase